MRNDTTCKQDFLTNGYNQNVEKQKNTMTSIESVVKSFVLVVSRGKMPAKLNVWKSSKTFY